MKPIIHWIETHSLPNSVVQGLTLVVFFAASYLLRYSIGMAIALILIWIVIANLFSKRPASEQATLSRFDKIAMYLLGAFLLIAFLDYKFQVINRLYEFYVIHKLLGQEQ